MGCLCIPIHTSQASTLDLLAAAGRRQGWTDGRIQRVQQLLQLRAASGATQACKSLSFSRPTASAGACTPIQVRKRTGS